MIHTATAQWGEEIELTRNSLLQVLSGGPVYVALEAPASLTDGAIMEDRNVTRFNTGTKLRLRAKGPSATIYIGPVG